MILVIVLSYFVYDILSLPQDIFYILAQSSTDFDPKDALTQGLAFGLAGANVLWMLGSQIFIFFFNLNNTNVEISGSFENMINNVLIMTRDQSIFLIPGYLSMTGSLSYAFYVYISSY